MQLSKERNKIYYVHCIMIILFMTCFGFLPNVPPVTHFGMQVLGVFIGCVYGWLIGSYIWPSVLGLTIMGFYGDGTPTALYTTAYGNGTLLMILWAFIFAHIMTRSGLLSVISTFILKSKLATRGPWALMTVLFTACAVAAAFCCTSTPATIMIWAIFYGIMEKLNIPKFSPYANAVLVGLGVVAYPAMIILPFNGSTQVVLGLMNMLDPTTVNFSYLNYILFWIIFNIIFIPVLVFFCKYILKIKAPFDKIDASVIDLESKSLTKQQKLVLIYIIILCLGMVLPSFLPVNHPIKIFLTRLGTNGLFIGINALMCITFVEGKSIQDIAEAMRNSVSWDIYFLVGTALCISPILTSEATGIGQALSNILEPIFIGKSPLIFTLLVLLIGLTVTNCINNGVTMTLLIPLVYTITLTNGANFTGLCVIFCSVLLMGVVMPSGSGQAALMHGNSEYLNAKDVYKYTLLYMIPFFLTICCIAVPLSNIMF